MEKEKPKVSLLLLNLGRKQMTNYVLANLLSKIGDIDYELLILNQGRELICFPDPNNYTGITEVMSDSNIGIAAGFNKLLREAQGEYICFLSNDILLGDHWLFDLIHYNDQIAKPGLTTIYCEGEKGVFTPQLTGSDSLMRVWKTAKNTTFGVSLIHRDALNSVGAFDESLGIYGREREQYAIRLHNLGYNNFYVPDQFSVHLGREVNDTSEYKKMKDEAKQLTASRFNESLAEMKKNNNYKIEI